MPLSQHQQRGVKSSWWLVGRQTFGVVSAHTNNATQVWHSSEGGDTIIYNVHRMIEETNVSLYV